MESATQTLGTPERIGEMAGAVWAHLNKNGPTDSNRLARQLNVSNDLVQRALGWLAREDKLSFQGEGRKELVSLK